MKRACKNCNFFEEAGGGTGLCRYEAPKGNDGYYAKWAVVRRDEWCGRFVAKDSTATAVVIEQPFIKE